MKRTAGIPLRERGLYPSVTPLSTDTPKSSLSARSRHVYRGDLLIDCGENGKRNAFGCELCAYYV